MKALYWPHINNGLFVTIHAFEIDRLGQKFNLAQMLNFDLVRKAIVGDDGKDGVEIRIIQRVFVNPKVNPDPVRIVVEDQRGAAGKPYLRPRGRRRLPSKAS